MRANQRRTGLAFVAVAVAIAWSGALAWACTPSASIDPVASPEGIPGTTETIVGRNFAKGPVQIDLVSQSGIHVSLRSVNGPGFSTTVTIPAGTAPGVYYILGIAVTSEGTFSPGQPYEVLGPDQGDSEEGTATPGDETDGGAPSTPGRSDTSAPLSAPIARTDNAPTGVRSDAVATPPVARRPSAQPTAIPAGGGSGPTDPSSVGPRQSAVASGPVDEANRALMPSPNSSVADLWSGFSASGSGARSHPGASLEAPVSTGWRPPVVGMAMLSLGVVSLMAATLAAARGRRRRVAAPASGTAGR